MRACTLRLLLILLAVSLVSLARPAVAAGGEVLSELKIGATQGGIVGGLSSGVRFGSLVTPVGDIDGDGIDDLLIGAARDDDGGTLELGAFWALQLAGVPAVCGDGVLSALEECDDGDVIEVNGCNTNCEIIPLPEPGGLAMLLSGIGLLHTLRRRRARRSP